MRELFVSKFEEAVLQWGCAGAVCSGGVEASAHGEKPRVRAGVRRGVSALLQCALLQPASLQGAVALVCCASKLKT